MIKKDNIEEHISFFINLSKKEGRGESSGRSKVLKGLFVGDLAEQFKKELSQYFGV